MSKWTREDFDEAHNKGQADGSKNDYSPPVPITILDEFTTPQDTLDEWRELNDAYDKGWNNGHNNG
jgi:hypothetical protein